MPNISFKPCLIVSHKAGKDDAKVALVLCAGIKQAPFSMGCLPLAPGLLAQLWHRNPKLGQEQECRPSSFESPPQDQSSSCRGWEITPRALFHQMLSP